MEWWQGKHSRHAARRRRKPTAGQHLMNRFLKHWRLTGCGDTFHAHVVSYADDFVILSRGRAAEALAWTKAVMTKLGLTINEAKTSLRNARKERFDFLGYSFGAHLFEASGNWYQGASPSKKSVQRLKTKVVIFCCRAISIHGQKCVTS
jgi:RNA-directed DNA polymerase